MSLPWVIGLLSTDYDLHNHREAIIGLLKHDDIILSAFELPDFPVEPDKNSHNVCLTALKRTDVVILVIDKRYGGIYYDSTNVSITQEEYFSAMEMGIPCLVFVSQQAWNETQSFYIDLKKNINVNEDEFAEEYNCKYVTDVKTIFFINNIQKSYNTKGFGNWITFFENIPDLLNKVKGKLEGLSRFWIKKIVNKQFDCLKARKTSTSFSMSLGDVFDKGYYIEPQYSIESGSLLENNSKLENAVVAELSNKKSVFVYGEAGYGKTTILAKSFLEHVAKFNKEDGYDIPFYIWLKDKSNNYHFDFFKYLQECFEIYYGKRPYPYLDISSIIPYFYLDGFDEIAEKISLEEVNSITQSTIFNYPIMLTCRIQYAFRYLRNFEMTNKFNVCIKIKKWNSQKAKIYIDNFCMIKGKDRKYVDRIYGLLTNNKELNELLDNPLLITMLLWIIEANRMDIPETILTRVELFQECFKEMARRELHRSKITYLNENDLILIWSYFAWLFYRDKVLKKKSKIKNLLKDLQTNYLEQYGQEYNETLFEVLFDTAGEYVYGTFHEQFLEFLVANSLHYACLNNKAPYPDFLRYVLRPEINRYFSAICNEDIDYEKEKIASNIFQQYLNNLGCNDNASVSTRVHAIYHVSRLSSTSRETSIYKAFEVEKNISVLLSLFFGVIKMGWLDKEDQFYNLLLENEQYNIANRGYHLAYYSDMSSDGELPFLDSGKTDWSNTLKAFIRHFESTGIEQFFLRRIDLVTMLQFIESRKATGPLTQDMLEHFGCLVSNPIVKNKEDFQKKIERALNDLQLKYNEINKLV